MMKLVRLLFISVCLLLMNSGVGMANLTLEYEVEASDEQSLIATIRWILEPIWDDVQANNPGISDGMATKESVRLWLELQDLRRKVNEQVNAITVSSTIDVKGGLNV